MVSTRYAQAFLESKIDNHDGLKLLEKLAVLYTENDEFRQMLNSPRLSNEVKIDIVGEVASNNKTFLNFISLLLNEKRINLINDIYHKYLEMINKMEKRIKIEIVSAMEIEEYQIALIVDKYKKMYDANEVIYETKIDKSLIGGVMVIVGDKVYDDTIRTKLNEML